MELTAIPEPLRRTVRETRGASLYSGDEDSFRLRIEVSHSGSAEVHSGQLMDAVHAADYALVDAEYDIGEKLLLWAAPRSRLKYGTEDGSKSDFQTMIYDDASVHENHGPGDHVFISPSTPSDTIEAGGYLRLLNRMGVPVLSVSGSAGHSPTLVLTVDFNGEGKDPYEMAGINEREDISLQRHEALTLVRALDAFDEDEKNVDMLRSRLVSEYNLDSYLHYLDSEA